MLVTQRDKGDRYAIVATRGLWSTEPGLTRAQAKTRLFDWRLVKAIFERNKANIELEAAVEERTRIRGVDLDIPRLKVVHREAEDMVKECMKAYGGWSWNNVPSLDVRRVPAGHQFCVTPNETRYDTSETITVITGKYIF